MGQTPPAAGNVVRSKGAGTAVEGDRHPQQQHVDAMAASGAAYSMAGTGAADTALRSGNGGAGTAAGADIVEAKGRPSSRSLRRGGGRAVRRPESETDDSANRDSGYSTPKTATALDNVMRRSSGKRCTAPTEGRFEDEGVHPLVEYVVHIDAAGERGRHGSALAASGTLEGTGRFEEDSRSSELEFLQSLKKKKTP